MIRRAGPLDPAALAAIHATAFPQAEAWSEAVFAGHLSMPGVFALLDDAGGMLLARVAADEAELLTLAVAPACRRRGIARALLTQASSIAALSGAARLFLEVSDRNAAARALYVGLGFTPVGRRPAYYPDGSDALILAAPLPAQGRGSALDPSCEGMPRA